MSLLSRRKVLAAKIESTSGTAESLAASEGAYNVFDFEMQPAIGMTDRPGQGGFGSLAAISELRTGSVSFKTEIYGDGAGGVPAWASTFLPACGWTNSAGTFSPKSEAPGTNVKTITIGMFIDGMYKVLRGCAGTARFVFETGVRAHVEWSFQGVWQAVTSSSLIAPTYPTILPLRTVNTTFTYDSWSPCWSNLTIDMGNTIYLRPCQTNADESGLKGAIITDRRVTGQFDPESVATGTYNYYNKWITHSEASLSVDLENSTDKITLAAPKTQIVNIQQGDRNGILIENISFQCNRSAAAGNDELTIAFSAP